MGAIAIIAGGKKCSCAVRRAWRSSGSWVGESLTSGACREAYGEDGGGVGVGESSSGGSLQRLPNPGSSRKH